VIPYRPNHWVRMLVSSRGSLSNGVVRRMVAFGVIAALLWVAHRFYGRVVLSVGMYEVAGAVIALTLAFRTNTAYARFWEGRTLWGSIVNSSRNLVRIVQAHAAPSPEDARAFAVWVVVFAHATRRSLRGEDARPEIAGLLSPEEFAALDAHPHPPVYAAAQVSARLAAFARGSLDPNMAARAEDQVNTLVNCLGACERILKTPTPLGYVLLIQRCVALYLATLPLGLVGEIGVLTPLVTMMVAYPVLMIEALGRELDDPFGHEPNDIALSRICDTIERNLLGSSSLGLVMSSTDEPAYED
jgi:putative membrane protein